MAATLILAGIAAAGTVASTVISASRKAPQVNTPPTRVDRSGSVVADALQRRKGSSVNRRTGGLGVEASASSGTKSKLGT